jgi:hypothetical protein
VIVTFLNWLRFYYYDNVEIKVSQKSGKEMLGPDADTFCTGAVIWWLKYLYSLQAMSHMDALLG